LTANLGGTEREMRIHHLNCGTFCPWGGRLMDGVSRGVFGRLVCHCLLLETDRGLVLVDTGLGRRDMLEPRQRLSRLFLHLNRIQLRVEDTAWHQLQRLGFSPSDVRHVVLTHLDFDHAGGLDDFPAATVHLLGAEAEAARQARDFLGRRRYRDVQWGGRDRWQLYGAGGDTWFGFGAVRDLHGLPPEILLVPLAGHTRGHAGVAIEADKGWLLHAGDAYFFRGEVGARRRRCPAGLRGYQTMMEVDRQARLANQARLRALSLDRPGEVRTFCAHDAVEFDGWAARNPAARQAEPAAAQDARARRTGTA
jgi:glyoxylase-like metal-dependent hydrolase (beta-lactamase superfamily II)